MGQASNKGDCLWALAYTRQPAWGLLERVRMKPLWYKGAETQFMTPAGLPRETGGGAVVNAKQLAAGWVPLGAV